MSHAQTDREPSGEETLETSAGGVVYRRDGARVVFLVIRDSYRNWGFPKGHLEPGERADSAALREVREETGLAGLSLRAELEPIDWHFRFRGKRIHKVCHFFLIETSEAVTTPQRAEGITDCRWMPFDQATKMLAYENARAVLATANAWLVSAAGTA